MQKIWAFYTRNMDMHQCAAFRSELGSTRDAVSYLTPFMQKFYDSSFILYSAGKSINKVLLFLFTM